MICSFQTLYFGDEGYVVRCKECNNYQIAFITTLLTLTRAEFIQLYLQTMQETNNSNKIYTINKDAKSIIISTPTVGVKLLLTITEAERLRDILEEADVEEKTQDLLSLFNE